MSDTDNEDYKVECLHSGQKRAYGDSYREFSVSVISPRPDAEVEKYCTEHVYPCKLTSEQYLAELRAGLEDFGDHFRTHYSFEKKSEGEYFYQITQPSTH